MRPCSCRAIWASPAPPTTVPDGVIYLRSISRSTPTSTARSVRSPSRAVGGLATMASDSVVLLEVDPSIPHPREQVELDRLARRGARPLSGGLPQHPG